MEFVKTKTKIELIIFITLVILGSVALAVGPTYLSNRQQKRRIATHEAQIMDMQLTQIWHVDDFVSDLYHSPLVPREAGGKNTVNLIALKDRLLIFGGQDTLNYKLWQLNPETGDILSNRTPGTLSLPSSFKNISKVAYDSTYVYLAYTGQGRVSGTTFGAGGVAVYDPVQSKVTQSERVPRATSESRFIAGENFAILGDFLVYVSGGRQKTYENLPYPSHYAAVWYLQSIENPTEAEIKLWEHNLSNASIAPLVLDEILIVKKQGGSKIKIFDRVTGDELFNSPSGAISNVAVDNNFVFYLTKTNELVSMDLKTGSTTTIVQFSGEPFKEVNIRGYYVAADNNRIYIYLGDSRQLFAFEYTP